MELSIVIPLFNERGNLGPLHEELKTILAETSHEILFIDDGSTDGSADELRRIKETDSSVRVIRLAKNTGQTAALQCGFANSRGDIVVALDGRPMKDPRDVQSFLRGDYIGKTVPATILRGGKRTEVKITIAEKGK